MARSVRERVKLEVEKFGDELKYHDEEVHYGIFTTAKKKQKLSQRVMALSKYRMFIFGKSVTGKFSLLRDYPYFFLKKVESDKDEVKMEIDLPKAKAGTQNFVVIKSKNIATILDNLCTYYKQITFGWPEDWACDFSQVGVNVDTSNIEIGPAKGLVQCYKAYCNLHTVDPRLDLVEVIQDLENAKITDLDLSKMPGIDRKSGIAIDLPTLAYALRHNTYFRSFELRHVDHRDAMEAVALILYGNKTMTRIACVDTNAEVPELLGEGLEENRQNKVQILQITGTKIPPKSVRTLVRGLQVFPHVIKILDISNSKINNEGMTSLMNALMLNWGMTLGIEELNLSGIPLNQVAAAKVVALFSHMRTKSSLKRLSVAGIGVDVGQVLIELSFMALDYLDISDNKSAKLTQNQLPYFTEVTRNIQTLRLANVGVEFDFMKRALEKLFLNKNIKDLYLDISRNNFGPENSQALVETFKYAQGVKALNLADNDIREKAAAEIIRSLPPTIERLVLDRNFSNRPETLEFAAALGSWMATHPDCAVLSIQGDGRSKVMGSALTKFFFDLARNGSLEELDISGNMMGDHAFSEMCRSLRSNDGLKALKCDKNGISYSGYRAFVYMLKSNKTLQYVEPPSKDQNAQSQNTELYLETIYEINHILGQRRALGKLPFRSDPFLFDKLWPTPTTEPSPRHDVPNELFDVSNKIRTELNHEELVLPPVLSGTSTPLLGSSTSAPDLKQSQTSAPLSQSSASTPSVPPPPSSAPPPPESITGRSRAATKTAGGHLARAFTEDDHEKLVEVDEDDESNSQLSGSSTSNPPPSSPPPPSGAPPPPSGAPPPPSGVPPPPSTTPPSGSPATPSKSDGASVKSPRKKDKEKGTKKKKKTDKEKKEKEPEKETETEKENESDVPPPPPSGVPPPPSGVPPPPSGVPPPPPPPPPPGGAPPTPDS